MALLDATYAGLQAAIIDQSWRAGDSVFAAAVPDFIRAAEMQMNRKLRVRQMVTISTASISSEFAGIPADMQDPISFTLSDGTVLDCQPMGAVADDNWVSGGARTGKPMTYTIAGGQFQFSPIPNQAYSARLVYYAQIPQLSNSTTTNWLLTSHGDAYLYGALTMAEGYLSEDARVGTWGTIYGQIIDDLNEAYGETFGDRLTMQATFAP